MIPVLVLTLTILGIAGSHVLWDHPRWRKPLLWSDRWHLWSLLSYWPICGYVMWKHIPSGAYGVNWLAILLWSAVLWKTVKLLGGKAWPMWWTQVIRWIRR